jgi:hypothetical protein
MEAALFSILDALEQDMFLSVLIWGSPWMGGVWAGDVNAEAGDDIVSSWAEAEGVSCIEGMAHSLSEDGG